MNPSPAAIAAINTYVVSTLGGWTAVSDAQVVSSANAPAYPNPAPQGNVPVAYTYQSILAALSQSSAANVEQFPAVSQLFDDIIGMNDPRVLAAITLMAQSGRILSAEATAIEAIVGATRPDPSWASDVGWAQANLGRPLDTSDSAAARAAQ